MRRDELSQHDEPHQRSGERSGQIQLDFSLSREQDSFGRAHSIDRPIASVEYVQPYLSRTYEHVGCIQEPSLLDFETPEFELC